MNVATSTWTCGSPAPRPVLGDARRRCPAVALRLLSGPLTRLVGRPRRCNGPKREQHGRRDLHGTVPPVLPVHTIGPATLGASLRPQDAAASDPRTAQLAVDGCAGAGKTGGR